MNETNALPMLAGETEGIRVFEVKGELCMSAEDLGKCLGYADPVDGMDKLYQRHKDELEEWRFSVQTVRKSPGDFYPRIEGKTSKDFSGQSDRKSPMGRPRIFYYEEGIYAAGFLAKTEVAKEFRKRVAKLLKHLRLKQRLQSAEKFNYLYEELRKKRKGVTPKEIVEQIRTMYLGGASVHAVERHFDMPRTTVRDILKRGGIKIRREQRTKKQ